MPKYPEEYGLKMNGKIFLETFKQLKKPDRPYQVVPWQTLL